MEKSSRRRRVSGLEVRTLRLLYQYRFVTATLVAEYGLFNDPSNARRHLTRLAGLGLIGVRYDKSYKLAGRAGAYYLKTAGIKVLRYVGENLDSGVPHLISKDATASDRFEQHCLDVLKTAIRFLRADPLTQVITKSMLYGFDNVVQPLPDGFIRLSGRQFYIECIDETLPTFVLKKRLVQYAEDFEENEWEENGSHYPSLLLVTQTKEQFIMLKKRTFGILRQTDTDLPVYGYSLDFIEQNDPIYVFPMASYDEPGCLLKNL